MPFPYEIIAACSFLILIIGVFFQSKPVTGLAAAGLLPGLCLTFFPREVVLETMSVVVFLVVGSVSLGALSIELLKRWIMRGRRP